MPPVSTICLVMILMAHLAIGCDIILRVKSKTTTPFEAQIIAPSGKRSEKYHLNKDERLIFNEKAKSCGFGEFQIRIFKSGTQKEEHNVKVTLNGIGTVNYEVGDDLVPKQIFRQGATCEGQCAPLIKTPSPSRRFSPKANITL